MKRKSKGLALLLALMMLISMNPAIIFAEDTGGAGDTPAVTDEAKTPEEVHKELGEAIGSELDAAEEFFPTPETWEEVGAAVNDAAAGAALYEAEVIVESSDKLTEKAAEVATESAAQAGEDASAAKTLSESAATEAENAADYRDAVPGAASQDQANQIAAQAGAASSQARDAAGKAIARAQSAALEEEKAKVAYEAANLAYQAAKKEAEEKLNAGLIDAEQAKNLTADALDKANKAKTYWDEMKGKAETAAGEAVDEANRANQALAEQIDILNDDIKTTSQEVASDTGTAVVTGSALAAAKAAVAASMIEVTYYEGQINITEAEIAVVNKKIGDAEAKIEAAEAVVEVTKAALGTATDDYGAKMDALKDAESKLADAREAVDMAKDAIKQRDESGIKAQLNVVRTGDYNASDVHDVAEYLMRMDQETAPVIVWESLVSDVFTIDEQSYKVFVEDVVDPETGKTDRILSIKEYFPGNLTPISDFPDKEKEWKSGDEPGVQKTDMIVTYKNNPYEVFLRLAEDGTLGYEFTVGDSTLPILKDEGGFYFITPKKQETRYIDIAAPATGDLAVADTAEIADSWDDATAAENDLVAAQATYKGAATAKNIAAVVKGITKFGDDVAEANLNYQSSKKTLLDRVKGKLEDKLLKLDSKLGDPDRWVPTDEQKEKLDAAEQAAYEVYEEDAPITLERVKAVGKALVDFSIPATVRAGVAFYADLAADYAHRNAVNELKTDVTEGAATIQADAKATAEAGTNAVSANAKAAAAVITKDVVDKLAKDADEKQVAADEAAAKAAQAYDDYSRLAAVYGPNDQKVTEAEAAWHAAEGYAKDAKGFAENAKKAAKDAADAYAAAKENAKNWKPSNSDPGTNTDTGSTTNGDTAVTGGRTTGTPDATQSGNGTVAASSGTSRADTGDHSKTLGWLTTLCTAGFALAKGFLNKLKTQS